MQILRPFQTLALGLAAAAFTVSPVAHAATTATYEWTDFRLSITDAKGQTTVNQGFETTGDSNWQYALSLLADNSTGPDYEFEAYAPQPTLTSTTLSKNLGTALGEVILDTSVSNKLTTRLTSLADTPFYGTNESPLYGLGGSLLTVFDHKYLVSPDEFREYSLIRGGIWLEPGSTATLSGTSTARITLDPSDFEWARGLTQGSLTATGYMVMGLLPDGADTLDPDLVIDDKDIVLLNGAEIGELTATLQDQQAGLVLQDAQSGFVSGSVTNNHAEGRWLLLNIYGDLFVNGKFGGAITPPSTGGGSLIPEPSTYALMGLGLVGVAFAARRQRAGA